MKKLPEKDSDLLDLAVTDAIRASKKKGYRLDMGMWVVKERLSSGPNKGKAVCKVCMAGAVMTQTLGVRTTKDCKEFAPYGTVFEHQLRRINGMRMGCFGGYTLPGTPARAAQDEAGGYTLLGTPARAAHDEAGALVLAHYNENTGRAPWRVYRKAAAILREAGL